MMLPAVLPSLGCTMESSGQLQIIQVPMSHFQWLWCNWSGVLPGHWDFESLPGWFQCTVRVENHWSVGLVFTPRMRLLGPAGLLFLWLSPALTSWREHPQLCLSLSPGPASDRIQEAKLYWFYFKMFSFLFSMTQNSHVWKFYNPDISSSRITSWKEGGEHHWTIQRMSTLLGINLLVLRGKLLLYRGYKDVAL